MAREVSDQVYAAARAAALSLQAELKERLIGRTSAAWRCNCGACGAGPSRVVDIHIPSSYRYQIAMACLWTCNMEDDHGKGWSQGISTYIPYAEMYAMFRNRFAGIDVEVDHIRILMNHATDEFSGKLKDMPGPGFKPSGREVTITDGVGVFLRPTQDQEQSPWFDAELRMDCNLPNYATREPLLTMNVDPFAFSSRPRRGREAGGDRYNVPAPEQAGTFYAQLSVGADYVYLPIARLVEYDRANGAAIFELDETVEAFTPEG